MVKKTVGEQVTEACIKAVVGGVMAYGVKTACVAIDSHMKEKEKEKEKAITGEYGLSREAYNTLTAKERKTLIKSISISAKENLTKKDEKILEDATAILNRIDRIEEVRKGKTIDRGSKKQHDNTNQQLFELINKMNERLDKIEKQLGNQ